MYKTFLCIPASASLNNAELFLSLLEWSIDQKINIRFKTEWDLMLPYWGHAFQRSLAGMKVGYQSTATWFAGVEALRQPIYDVPAIQKILKLPK